MASPPSRAQVNSTQATNTTKTVIVSSNQTKNATLAQTEKKELPQSVSPVSDFFTDGLKKMASPPSRAQLEKQEQAKPPQSGNPISDAVLDTIRFIANPPSRAQVDQKELP